MSMYSTKNGSKTVNFKVLSICMCRGENCNKRGVQKKVQRKNIMESEEAKNLI